MRYLIVGAGAFGASTALNLKKTHPGDEVILIDKVPFPCPSAAGHDLNKIIRAEYDDLLYMELAIEAIRMWKSDPILKPFYHEIGILFAGTLEPGLKIVENFKTLTGSSPAMLLEPDDAKKRFSGIFRDGDWTGVTGCTWNPVAGWGEAEEALRSITQAAINIGVEYQAKPVKRILFDESGKCIGLETITGERILADKIVLCTGANTAKLLADSAPDRPDLHVGDRMVATAAAMCLFRVPEKELEKYASAPIIVSPIGDMAAESIPPGPKGLCKCTHELSFTNYEMHAASGQKISVPPKARSHTVWSQDVPQGLKDETHAIAKKVYGTWVEGLQPENYRMCWDSVTPNQDWVICPHPAAKGLYIASGGSFHGWKFLPNIGAYVTQMLDGKLDAHKASRWAWDRPNDGANCAIYVPSRDLKDIKGFFDVED